LRAIAVTLVLLFHANVPGMGGGYVGVDVFFVISGFVITGVLLRERASTAKTSIPRFYARRVRRIIPAATLVIVVAVVASYVVLGPLSGSQTAGDARWASFFLINVHFASTGTNYLASQLPPSVLQNYWSLAVEEQFYLVYPTIFLVVAALSIRVSLRRRLAVVLGAAMVVSFAISVVQTSSNQTAAYFSTFPRVWELAIGGLVAVSTTGLRRLPAPVAAALSWGGLALIILAAVTFSSSTAYPGSAVALPVLGAAFVIAGGVAKPNYGAELVLGLRPCQWVGLISYSLYLWHWPVLTIAAEHSASGTLSVHDALGWELVSVVLAVLTYRLVENPIRHNRSLISRRWASLALGGCLIVSSFAVATIELHAHPSKALATPYFAGLGTGAACPPVPHHELQSLEGVGPRLSDRVVARILVVGDSTACTMVPGLEAAAAPAGVAIEDGTVIGCGVVSGEIAPKISDGRNVNASTRICQQRATAAEDRAQRLGHPNVVLWASTWEREALEVAAGDHQTDVLQGSAEWYAVLQQRMEARVRALTASGATLVMLTQPPFYDFGNRSIPTPNDVDFARSNSLLTQFASRTPHVKVINLAARVCPSGPPCPLGLGGVWVRGDGEHYTPEGSLWVARWLLPQLGIKALDRPLTPLPNIEFVVPRDGATVSGATPLVAITSFNLGVAKVEFHAFGPAIGNVDIGRAVLGDGFWGLYWNTAQLPAGSYEVQAVAYDSVGHRSVSRGVQVRVTH
jgi:peptidoglycan/LPS O-acetylase OafA/YrhL